MRPPCRRQIRLFHPENGTCSFPRSVGAYLPWLYGVTFQKAVISVFTALRALNITLLYLFFFGSVFVLTSVMKSETYELRNSNSRYVNRVLSKTKCFIQHLVLFL